MKFACYICGLEKETKGEKDRVPKSWKRAFDAVWCPKCWDRAYVLRAVTVPIVGPVDPAQWPELRKALADGWANSTGLANWANDEMYARDVRRNGEAKCPPQPKTYLYPEAREAFPSLPSQTTAAILQAAAGKYRSARYETIWTRERALPTHRYPTPFVIPGQGWSMEFLNERPTVHARIGERRWSLILRGGPEFRRQLADLRAIVAGEAIGGELAILRKKANASDHRGGVSERGEYTSATWRVMVKIVGWFPRRQAGEASGVLRVRTGAESLLVAVDAKDERVWIENADHVRRWIAEYDRQRQRWSEDTKAEQRPVPSFAARRDAATQKQRNRMKSAIDEITSHVAKFAERRRFAEVVYDDADRSFAISFPWYIFRETLERKLTERGIKFTASAPVAKEDAGNAREETSDESGTI